MSDWTTMLLAAFGVVFIGLSKAGFGGGLGMLTTPLCVLAFSANGRPPSFAVGVLLPLLCAGDAFSLWHYWGKWERRNLTFLLPGVVVGVVIGATLIGRFSARQLNLAIGLLAVLFVVFQFVKEKIWRAEGAFAPSHLVGIPCGIGAGVTSTFAHGAGPVVSLFLIPQQMPKEIYVGTTVLVFTWINWIKLPFFLGTGIITQETLLTGLRYLPLVPLGVWLGVWLNRKVSERLFLRLVYAMTLLTGLQLIFNFNLAALLGSSRNSSLGPVQPLHTLRAGVIGTGFIGPVHIEALKRLGVQVTAICGSTRNARAAAGRWGIPEVHGDYNYRAMLASPNVDVVHITSPNKVHVEQSLAALAAGKHVVCEKPLGMTPRETAKVVAAAARPGAPVFAVNYMCRFFPAVLQMRALVQRGDLGRILHVQGHFFQDWLLKETDYNWRLLASEGGKLRAVGDIGTHWIDAVSFILGAKAESVFAHIETAHKTRRRPKGEVQTFASVDPKTLVPYRVDTEDFGSVLLKFGRARHEFVSGVHANASISQVAAGWKCSLALGIYGANGSVRWDLQQPNEILLGRRDEPNQILQRATAGFSEDVAGFTDYPGGHPEGFADSHKMQYRAVYEHIAGGRRAPALFATAADGHHEVQLCEAVLRSSRAKRWVAIG